jgi:hypothetical protein
VSQDVLAYVGCIAGAILIEDYRRGLLDAGFEHVEVIDSKADLNVYEKIEGQAGCCSPAASVVEIGSTAAAACCAPSSSSLQSPEFLGRLHELLTRYNVNDYAASVKVFAVKPS